MVEGNCARRLRPDGPRRSKWLTPVLRAIAVCAPVIGARGKVRIWKAVSLYAEGDVGGFNVNADTAFELRRQGRTIVREPVNSSDWSYQAQGGLEFQITRWLWLQTGWRYLKYVYRKNGFTDMNALNGPLIQLGVNF